MTARHAPDCRCWECIARENGPGRFSEASGYGSQALEGAYWQGWCEAANWAQRDDLKADRDSQAYADAMNRRLSPLRPQPTPAPPVAAAPGVVASEPAKGMVLVPLQSLKNARAHIDRGSWDIGAGILDKLIDATPPASPVSEVLAEPVGDELKRIRHVANEWADMASNGLQWVRNIAEGISKPADALANLEDNMKHCREVNDAAPLADRK